MASMPTKIVLKSTTNMSLNDRFSTLPKVAPPPQQSAKKQAAINVHASQANRRLAQQMANRPTVQAALKTGGVTSGDVKQRLGNKGSVKSRLTLPPRGRGRGRGGLVARSPQRGGLRLARGGAKAIVRGRGAGYKIRGGRVQRVQSAPVTRGARGGSPRVRGVTRSQTARGARGGAARGRAQSAPTRGQGRGMRGGRGGLRGRGRGRGAGQQNAKSKEQLDTDLDSYMSKSRAHLDAELDAYMASLD